MAPRVRSLILHHPSSEANRGCEKAKNGPKYSAKAISQPLLTTPFILASKANKPPTLTGLANELCFCVTQSANEVMLMLTCVQGTF